MPELRRLQYFLAVARERNFTRAAEVLHVAQPALSRQVRLLERELGVELLHRTTHTFELSAAGTFLLERGPAVLDAADDLWRATASFGAGERGHVAFGYGASAGYETVPKLVRTLAERLPDLEVTTAVMSSTQILSGVREGAIDVGVLRCPPTDGAYESRLLRVEAQGVLLRRDDPRGGADSVTMDALADTPFLMHPRDANPGHYDAVLELCRARGVDPRVVHRAVSFDLAQTPVVAGEAVAIVGESSRLGLPGELTWLRLQPPAGLETRLVARALGRTPATDRLLAAAEEIADELGWRDGARDAGRR